MSNDNRYFVSGLNNLDKNVVNYLNTLSFEVDFERKKDSRACGRSIVEVYDPLTGELMYRRESEPKKFDLWDDKKGYIYKSKSYKTRIMNMEEIYSLCDSDQDFSKLMRLIGNLDSNGGNYLCVGSGELKRRATLNDIMNKLDTSEDTTKRFLKRMEQKSFIRKSVRYDVDGEKYFIYIANPNYFMGGKRINDEVYLTFIDEINANIPDNVKLNFAVMHNRKKYGTTD